MRPQVLHALDEPLPVINYNTWICHFPEASFLTEVSKREISLLLACLAPSGPALALPWRVLSSAAAPLLGPRADDGEGGFQVGNDQFLDVLRKYYGDDAAKEWIGLKQLMRPLARASTAVPSAAVRTDAAALLTLGRFLPRLLLGAPLDTIQQLVQPYSEVIKGKVKHPFILRWMDLLCFLLSGAPASGTLAAEIGFMFDDWCAQNPGEDPSALWWCFFLCEVRGANR